MRIGKLIVEKRSPAEVRAIKQAQIDAIRKGGFAKQASRAQAKLDRRK